MNTFSEIYNTYFNITSEILNSNQLLSKTEIMKLINEFGYSESFLYLVPKLTDESGWQLLTTSSDAENFLNSHIADKNDSVSNNTLKNTGSNSKNIKNSDIKNSITGNHDTKNIFYRSVLNNTVNQPVSLLQKRWLKTLLNDERITLFTEPSELTELQENLKDVEPLFDKKDFYYYDRFGGGDDFSDVSYRQNFKLILNAIQNHEYLAIEFHSHTDRRINHWFYPAKLEYSVRNNVFRLYAIEARNRSHHKLFTINISRICSIKLTGRHPDTLPDIDKYITDSYNREPVTVLIKNERNALERAMLQFANYKKNTTHLHDDIYQCEIFYNKSNETELLIEILSYGPLMKVVGNEHFLKLIRGRLEKQISLM